MIEIKAQSQIPQLVKIDTVFNGFEKSIIGQTNSMPPSYIYGTTGYKYQITLHLFISGSTDMIDTPLFLLSSSTFNRNLLISKIEISNLVKVSNQLYTYSLPITIRNQGETYFVLAAGEISELHNKAEDIISNSTNKKNIYFAIPIK